MIQDVLHSITSETSGKIALVLFFLIFVSIVLWACTRSSGQVKRWASIPLDQDTDGKSPREERP